MMKKIGVLGGTFDPPHNGHMILAADAIDQLGLDHLLWVLTHQPPHKLEQVVTPVEDRESLLEAAIRFNPSFRLSCVDLERPGPHYAADTIRIIKQENPDDLIAYIIGGDSLSDLPSWYQPDALVQEVDIFGVMRRPDDDVHLDELDKVLPGIKDKIQWIHSPLIGISSTDIRIRIAAGRPYQYMVPSSVYRMMEKKRYYCT